MSRLALIISFITLTAVTTRAQEMANINPDAATAGMANVSTAVSSTSFSVYGNAAAALFDFERFAASFSYMPQKSSGATENYYAVGGYYSFNEKNTLEAGVRIHNMPDTGGYRSSEYSADVAYAYLVHKYAGVSLTAHYIRGSYGNNVNYNALSFDFATYVQLPLDKMLDGAWVAIGAKIADVGFAFNGNENKLPSRANAGAALYAPIGDSHSLMGSIDLGYRFASSGYNSFGMSIGAEYTLMQLLSLRAGYHIADKKGIDYGTIGAGLSFMMLRIDFSYLFASAKTPQGDIYSIGVGISF